MIVPLPVVEKDESHDCQALVYSTDLTDEVEHGIVAAFNIRDVLVKEDVKGQVGAVSLIRLLRLVSKCFTGSYREEPHLCTGG